MAEPSPTIIGIKKLIKTIAEKEGFKEYRLDIKAISTHGANFMGDLYLVDVMETGKDTLKLFAKCANTPGTMRVVIDAHGVYKREAFVYTEIADIFHKLQDKHNIPEYKQFKFPKFYGACLEEYKEVIVLENLAAQGFVLHDRFKPMNWEYTKAGIEEIAKFHSLSFALKKEDPELFKILMNYNKSLCSDDYTDMAKMMLPYIPMNIALVEPEHRQKIEAYFEIHKHGIFKEHYIPISKHSVFVHCDYRLSNIMVKYEEETLSSPIAALSIGENNVNSNIKNKEMPVAALKPVDYQGMMYGCPLNDVIYFLFSGTDAEFRKLHFEEIIEHYHNSLADHLKLMSHDINDIYPKSTFYFELKDKMMYGIEIALILLSGVLIDPNVTIKLEDFMNIAAMENMSQNMPDNRLYKERLNGIVRDYVRWGLLK